MTALATDRGDVRAGGRWSLAQRIKNDTIYALATGTLAVAERLPASWSRALGRALGSIAWTVLSRPRQIALANVSRVLPDVDAEPFVRRLFRDLGERLGEVVGTLDPTRPLPLLPFLPGARACLDEAIAEGRGVVFASAHLGPWERVAATLAAAGVSLTVVAREPYDPRFGRIYERLRGARGVATVYRGANGAGIRLVRVLKRGGVLGIPMDLASRVPSVLVPFLGSDARTPVGPARLALRTGAAVVVGAATPEGIHFERLHYAASESGAPRKRPPQRLRSNPRLRGPCSRGGGVGGEAPDADEELALTRRINDALSARIRAWPGAWPWMHARWD